jgi:polysaccharide chain length determinant protein (PEP-CTERM system associated)
MHELAEQLFSYLKSTWRYRWFAMVVAWLIASAGWIVADRMPDLYQAWARVYVDTQSMLRPLLSGLAVQPNDDQIVRMMSRVLISRPNLEKVIQMAGMDRNISSPEERARVVSRLTNEITIRADGRENIYTILYEAQSPQEAKRIVESLLSLFVQESVGDKRKDADIARRFIEEQLKSYGEKLRAAEKGVMEFKREHVGLMPGEGQGYYAQLRGAETALRQARLDLREAENSRNAIRQQLESYKTVQGDKAVGEGLNPDIDARINALEKKLDGLRITYTDQHPDVVAIVRMISHLKEQRAEEAKLTKPGQSGKTALDLGQQQLMVSLSSAEANVAALGVRVAEHDRRYNELKAVANALPRVEAEYTQLTRDYDVIRARYNKLLERREAATISGEVEDDATTMGFRVVDPPRLPLSPSAPNRPRVVTVVLLAALAGGLGIAFLLGQIRPTFDNERKLREFTGLPVLGTVVTQWTNAQRARRRRGLAAFIVSVAGLLSAYGAIMASLLLIGSRA